LDNPLCPKAAPQHWLKSFFPKEAEYVFDIVDAQPFVPIQAQEAGWLCAAGIVHGSDEAS
jgi:hypothetical protein